MSHGLNLTAANTVVWYAPVNNFETYEQANARVRRPGQTDKTLIVHLVGTPVERVMYQRLRDRASFQGMLLELFHQQDLEF
jgi:SNF2 family DNA or RNA helicase